MDEPTSRRHEPIATGNGDGVHTDLVQYEYLRLDCTTKTRPELHLPVLVLISPLGRLTPFKRHQKRHQETYRPHSNHSNIPNTYQT